MASRKRKSRRIESSDEEDSDGDTEASGSFKKFKMTPKVDIEKASAKKVKEVTGASPPTTTSTTSKAKRKLNTPRSSDEEEEDDDEPKSKVVYVQDAIDQFTAA